MAFVGSIKLHVYILYCAYKHYNLFGLLLVEVLFLSRGSFEAKHMCYQLFHTIILSQVSAIDNHDLCQKYPCSSIQLITVHNI